MKGLNIKIEKDRDNLGYYVYLEWDNFKRFKTKRQAQKYVNDIEKSFLDYIRMMANLQTTAFHLYMVHYHQMGFDYSKPISYHVKKYMDDYERIHYQFLLGGTSIITKAIRNCFNHTESMLLHMKKFAQRHKQTSLHYELNSQLKLWQMTYDGFNQQMASYQVDLSYRSKEPLKVLRNDENTKNKVVS